MKKLLIFLFSLFLLTSPFVFAEDISDFEIEGISIGDSLLDYMTEDEILEEIELYEGYSYLNEPYKYTEVFLYKDFPVFTFLSVMLKHTSSSKYVTNKKNENEKYMLLSIRGNIDFINDFEGCIQKRDEIDADLSNLFPDEERRKETYQSNSDPSGKSIVDEIGYYFKSGAKVSIYCVNFEETFRTKMNWTEGLSISIRSKEVQRWLENVK